MKRLKAFYLEINTLDGFMKIAIEINCFGGNIQKFNALF
jgi:hypothetical protein